VDALAPEAVTDPSKDVLSLVADSALDEDVETVAPSKDVLVSADSSADAVDAVTPGESSEVAVSAEVPAFPSIVVVDAVMSAFSPEVVVSLPTVDDATLEEIAELSPAVLISLDCVSAALAVVVTDESIEDVDCTLVR
jgi:hypothetical protein